MFRRKRTSEVFVLLLAYMVTEIEGIQYVYDEVSSPCSFFETINITDGITLKNESHLHDGIVYPEKYFGSYEYEFASLTSKKSVQRHLRGCICLMKKCVRMCCENGKAFDSAANTCVSSPMNYSTILNVQDAVGRSKKMDITKTFGFVYGHPCERMYFLRPLTIEDDAWTLFENGTIMLAFGNTHIPKNEYCLSPVPDGNLSQLYINPAICPPYIPDETNRNLIYGVTMCISVPFFIATILVYGIIPELRNLHGKSLCCYLASLSVGYCCFSYILVADGIAPTDPKCELLGYTAYFSFMASFFWVSVISFDLWWNFRIMTSRGEEKLKRFILYSIYSWGLALLFLIFIMTVQRSNISNDLKPGIGGGQFCWIDTRTWMTLVYFYGPLILIISFNIVMFVLTSYKIHRVKKETSKVMGREDSRRNYSREKENIGLFLRLFIVMGVTWSTDIISWLFKKDLAFLFYVTDICNAIQGLIIFLLFVMKNKVKLLILKRYNSIRGIRGDTSISRFSTKTSSCGSSMTMTAMNSGINDATDVSLMPTLKEDPNEISTKNRKA